MERIGMSEIMEIFSLHFKVDLSNRKIAASLSISQGTISNYPDRQDNAKPTWTQSRNRLVLTRKCYCFQSECMIRLNRIRRQARDLNCFASNTEKFSNCTSQYVTDRIEAACQHALAVGTISYSSLESIFQSGLHGKKLEKAAEALAIHHFNIRGPNTCK